MAIDILSESATGKPVRVGVGMVRMPGPGYSAQQLHRYQIALVHSFDFDRDIDQTIGLHHGGQNPRSLSTGCANLEDTLFLREYTAKKVSPIRPFRKPLLKDRLHDGTTITPVTTHLEHRRAHKLLERHHGRHRISRKAEG